MIKTRSRLFGAEEVHRRLPVNFREEDLPYFIRDLERELPDSYLYQLQDVTCTEHGIVFDRFLRILGESRPHDSLRRVFGVKYVLGALLRRRTLRLPKNETYLLATDPWSPGYFHWIGDVLPRLYSVRELCSKVVFLLPESCSMYKETLRPFPFKGIQVVPSGTNVRLSRVVMPGHVASTGNYREHVMSALRTIYRATYDADSGLDLGSRIFVSRSRSQHRYLKNEEQVRSILESEFGFKTVHFEDHSFSDQVAIAAHTQHLVSAHGGGLTNMLFMPPSASILELRMRGDEINLCYFSLASALRLRYLYLFGDPVHGGRTAFDEDLVIPGESLRSVVEVMMS